MNTEGGGTSPDMRREFFQAGLSDLVILPLVTLALAVAKIIRALFTLLIHLIDWLFPILLQIVRFPLFTLRIVGDGIVALVKTVLRILPVGGTRRAAWRDAVSAYWALLRQKLSYRAFEEWLHHAFENGMAWVFRTCKRLTPGTALLVLFGAVLWLPISFGMATLLHTVLIAKATSLPAWMQLLHPIATIIAKTKLLVLPVYPAAWPQAKAHPLVQAMICVWDHVLTLYLVRKTGARYRQTEWVAVTGAEALGQAVRAAGLAGFGAVVLDELNKTAASIGRGVRAALLWLVERLAAIPLFGGIVRRYEEHYDEVSRQPKDPVSERVSGFFSRWSVKFTAKYYEDREREEAAREAVGG